MIIFSDVSKEFGDQQALVDLSFQIDDGEMVMITGPSGSGKTTLMRLLTREYVPSKGEITFNGERVNDIKSSKVHDHRRKIGVVFQDYKLLDELNVWENIALALSIINTPESEIEARVTDLLQLVDLPDKAYLFPHQLSGGEAQRVSIARALSTAPKVIFADEPTGNLDSHTSKNIIELIKKINKLGTTVIVTTHDPGVMEILDKSRHLELDKGKLLRDSGGKKTAKAKSSKEETKEEKEPKPEPEETKTKSRPKLDLDQETTKPKEADSDSGEEKSKKDSKPESTESSKKTRFSFKLPRISLPFGGSKASKETPDKSENSPDKAKEDSKSKSPDKKEDSDQEMPDKVKVKVEKI